MARYLGKSLRCNQITHLREARYHLVDVAIDYPENTCVLVDELCNRQLGVEPS
jgi:hypothetical protein